MMNHHWRPRRVRATVVPAMLALVASTANAAPPRDAASLVAGARNLGASEVTSHPAPNGGVVLDGKLDGRQFAIAVPHDWNGEAVAYAHGYSLPASPVSVAADPTSANAPMLLQVAYADGMAAGHIAYDKPGMGVKTGATNTLLLNKFLARLGASKVYVAGESMGGNIVMALLEQHPGSFAGGLAACGVTDGWESQMGHLFDARAAYNLLTSGTPYALPGIQDIGKSALPMTLPTDSKLSGEQFIQFQTARIATPILALFKAAAGQPEGKEAQIIRQVAQISGFPPDAASLVYPIVVASLGTDDLHATFGGQVYGNIGKVYAPVGMSVADAARFNADIQRISADPSAVTEARLWHQVRGTFRDPLVAIHNSADPLVPYSQAEALARLSQRGGAASHLSQYTLPEMHEPLPLGGVEGLVHCGFTREQLSAALGALRHWVTQGERPRVGAVK